MKNKQMAESKNGQIIHCERCGIYHVEFGNLYLPMWIEQIYDLWESLKNIDTAYYEWANEKNMYRRKIMIPLKETSVYAMFTEAEVKELCDLLWVTMDRALLPEELQQKAMQRFFEQNVRASE